MNSSIEALRNTVNKVIRGKANEVDLLLTAVFAGGHVLLEDLPGVGKTTLARALARSMDLSFSRIQFTPDLLPSDLLGVNVFHPADRTFSFREGPVFAHFLMADEINRASPRTQSALLEAMNEGQVTIDNETRMLPNPFFVIATQNPIEHHGTYPLPEAQLDRFFMRLQLGYPAPEEELQILFDRQSRDPIDAVQPQIDQETLRTLQRKVQEVTVETDVARYVLRIVHQTRTHPAMSIGASPRAALALFRAAQSRAFMNGRTFATPGDVQAMCVPVLGHRMKAAPGTQYTGASIEMLLQEILDRESVPV